MEQFRTCYIECIDHLWYIMWPDCTKAWDQGYNTRGWAVRTLKELQR